MTIKKHILPVSVHLAADEYRKLPRKRFVFRGGALTGDKRLVLTARQIDGDGEVKDSIEIFRTGKRYYWRIVAAPEVIWRRDMEKISEQQPQKQVQSQAAQPSAGNLHNQIWEMYRNVGKLTRETAVSVEQNSQPSGILTKFGLHTRSS